MQGSDGLHQALPGSHILLNDLDWELHRRGYHFVRYADDCQVYIGSREAGERVLTTLQRYLSDSLRLKVNTRKSAVDRPWNRPFLGFTFSRRCQRIKVSHNALLKLKATIRRLSRRTRGHSTVQIITELKKSLLGWKAYFGIAGLLSPLRDLDRWIRRKLRCYIRKQWGRRGYRHLRRLGEWTAYWRGIPPSRPTARGASVPVLRCPVRFRTGISET